MGGIRSRRERFTNGLAARGREMVIERDRECYLITKWSQLETGSDFMACKLLICWRASRDSNPQLSDPKLDTFHIYTIQSVKSPQKC